MAGRQERLEEDSPSAKDTEQNGGNLLKHAGMWRETTINFTI